MLRHAQPELIPSTLTDFFRMNLVVKPILDVSDKSANLNCVSAPLDSGSQEKHHEKTNLLSYFKLGNHP